MTPDLAVVVIGYFKRGGIMRKTSLAIMATAIIAGCTPADLNQAKAIIAAAASPSPSAAASSPAPIPTATPMSSPTPSPTPAPLGSIRVRVLDPNGKSETGATVTANCADGCSFSDVETTGSDGAAFTGLPPGASVTFGTGSGAKIYQTVKIAGGANPDVVLSEGVPTGNGPILNGPAPIQQSIFLNGTGRSGLSSSFQLLSGVRTFTASFGGDGNFVVWLQDANGNDVVLLFNEIGDANKTYTKTFTQNIQLSGTYYINVQAASSTDPWSVTIR